jgi:hypothetical protein
LLHCHKYSFGGFVCGRCGIYSENLAGSPKVYWSPKTSFVICHMCAADEKRGRVEERVDFEIIKREKEASSPTARRKNRLSTSPTRKDYFQCALGFSPPTFYADARNNIVFLNLDDYIHYVINN